MGICCCHIEASFGYSHPCFSVDFTLTYPYCARLIRLKYTACVKAAQYLQLE